MKRILLLVLAVVALTGSAQQPANPNFPKYNLRCTEGGEVVLEMGISNYQADPKAPGYIMFKQWNRRHWIRTNAVCVIRKTNVPL